jgi:hypothetical protein
LSPQGMHMYCVVPASDMPLRHRVPGAPQYRYEVDDE